MSSDTGKCEKCESEISANADRCPECGYEPSLGALGGIVMWVVVMVGSLFAIISIVSFIVIFTGEIIAGVVVGGVTGIIAAVCFGLIYFGIKNSMRGPTDPPVIGD